MISYFQPFQSFLKRNYSIWMAQETAFTARANFFFFLQMQAKLLKVRILMLPRFLGVSTNLPTCGVINRSTALVINLRSILSFSCLKFSIVILLIFNTKFTISCETLKGTALIVFLSRHIMAKCNNFSSFNRHSMVISQPRCRWASITFHSMITTVASLTSLFSSDIYGRSFGCDRIWNYYDYNFGIRDEIRWYYKNRNNRKLMEELVVSAYQSKNWDLLSEILHNKNEFLEIQYALGPEQFQQFVSTFELLLMAQHQGMELTTGQLYYFVSGGSFAKKIQKSREGKGKKNGNRKGNACNQVKNPINCAAPIAKGFLTSIEDFLSSQSKPTEYYYSLQSQSTILRLNFTNLQPSICQKLKNYFSTKLKFLNRLPLFKEIPKALLQQSLPNFKFAKISFNDLIYSQTLRPTSIFILMKGEAVIEDQIKSKGIIVKPPTLMGDLKFQPGERARCLTQFCVCFRVQKNQIQNIFKRKAEMDEVEYQANSTTSMGLLRVKYFRQLPISSEKQSNINPHRKSKKMAQLPCTEAKKQRIKQHFSNFLSDKYTKYSTKLQHQKPYNQNTETPILYQMKSLNPSFPNYSEIHLHLKQQRLKKILQAKQNICRSNSSQSLLRLHQYQESCRNSYRVEKDCIDVKIERNLEYRIGREINRKYGMRVRPL